MIVLALDTSLATAAACVWSAQTGLSLASRSVDIARGHDRILISLIDGVMSDAGLRFEQIDRIATTIGPGSFTGLRIAVAAARAIGLALDRPVVGVTTLEGFAAAAAPAPDGAKIIAAIDARNGRAFGQIFDSLGRPEGVATLAQPDALLCSAGAAALRLAGPGGPLLIAEARKRGRRVDWRDDTSVLDIAIVARLGALANPGAAPRPLYIERVATTLDRGGAPTETPSRSSVT